MTLKILFLSHRFSPDIGGIETNSEILARAFSNAEHEVHLLTWSTDSTEKTFPFTVIRNPTKQQLFREHAWANIIFENNPCLRLSWPSLFFGRPTVIVLNSLITQHNTSLNFYGFLKMVWLRRAKRVISVSNAVRKHCWPNATVIGNPYRVGDFRILPDVSRTNNFVFLGRLVSQKGVDRAIRAFYQLRKSTEEGSALNPDSSLTIIGDGPEQEFLENLVAELNLTSYVHFVGLLSGEALITCLNQHRFLLVPSIFDEAFGNVVLEGMACGNLPIVSDSHGLPEAVGKAGLVFDRSSVDALTDCIRHLLTSPALAQQLLDAAPAHLAAHHPDKISQQYLAVLETVFASN